MYTHVDAGMRGFFTEVKNHIDGGVSAKPRYPGVALFTVDPITGQKGVEALVQIIPADNNIVYSELIISGATKDEFTINMVCRTKETAIPVRFLLGNMSNDKTLFSVSDGRNTYINLVIGPKSYSKIPGTDTGKEVTLGDTGLCSTEYSDQMKRPATGTCYTITIGKPTATTTGYLETFDNSTRFRLHPIAKWNEPSYMHRSGGHLFSRSPATSACSTVSDGPTSKNPSWNCPMDTSDDNVDEIDGATSCVSAVTSTDVSTQSYSTVSFTTKVSYAVKVYFSKTLYVEPNPVVPGNEEVVCHQFTRCRGTSMFFCPHASYELKKTAFKTVEHMKCECVRTDIKKYAAIKVLETMLMK